MSKVENLRIHLSKASATYYPGEMVVGSVRCQIETRLKINQIVLKLQGDGKVNWSEKVWLFEKCLSRHEKFCRETTVLDVNNEHNLRPGEYSIPFEIRLPSDIPCSFKCEYGTIEYSIACTIDVPWAPDYEAHKEITVRNNVDLNLFPLLKQPYHLNERKDVGYLYFKSGIHVKINFKKTGFVCQEMLLADVYINNKSTTNLSTPFIGLYEKITLRAFKDNQKTIERLIYGHVFPKGVPRASSERFNDIGFKIPTTEPSSQSRNHLIDLEYYFALNIAELGMDRDFRVPVTIGTVPFHSAIARQQPQQSIDEDPPSYEASIRARIPPA